MYCKPPALSVLAAALATVVLAAQGFACSQSMCGSPTPADYLLGDETTRVSYGVEDRYLSKENALLEENGSEAQTEHRVAGFVLYRPTHRIALRAQLPWVWKNNTEHVAGAGTAVTRSSGLGDGELLARWDFMHYGNMFTRRGFVGVVASVEAPTGFTNQRDASGERLETHLQPGTGAWSGTFGLASDLGAGSTSWSASLLGRANGENARGYHYGNVLLFNAGYARTLSPSWQGSVELNGRVADRDRTEADAVDPNTGGGVLYVAPSLRWSGLGPIALDLLVQVPVASNLYGDQTERTTGRLAVVWLP